MTNLGEGLGGFPISSGVSVTTFVVFNSIRLARGYTRTLLRGTPRFSCVLAPRTGDVPLTCRVDELDNGGCVIVEGDIGICVSGPIRIVSRSLAARTGRSLCLNRRSNSRVRNGHILVISSIVSANNSVGTSYRMTGTFNTRVINYYTPLTRNSTTSESSVFFLRGLPLFFGWFFTQSLGTFSARREMWWPYCCV